MENLSRGKLNRAELFEAIQTAGREHSTATVMFHSVIAGHFGMNLTDWKCADIIHKQGPLTAGQIAELTGLTTGAVTGLIDRLEKVGIVRRQPDPNDRRRVIIEPVQGWEEKAYPLFGSMIEAFAKETAIYSDEELALILDFMRRSTAVMQKAAAELRAGRNND